VIVSEYAIKWGVEPGELDGISGEVRDELLDEVTGTVGEPLEMKHAPRQLSGDLEGIVTIGTIFASNPDQLMLPYREGISGW